MASILRQIVAGPRARHEETGLDLCYVTSNIIATSGPSQTYPQRAYRNPLDRLVAFLDKQHGDNWAIWEFRGEGTGYPDEAVYGRIRHYPWPDHHPPPFRLVPMIMASMRAWLAGEDLHGTGAAPGGKKGKEAVVKNGSDGTVDADADVENGRVVVVHCKAGKGRSGSMACSFLISERGWTPEAALARFTERRMRPKFGAGVSIPSQLRWISYVDRWTKTGKKYVDRRFEIVEIHAWGLRSGVKMSVEVFADEGRRIEVLHTFTRDERVIVEGETPKSGGVSEVIPDLTKMAAAEAISTTGDTADYEEVVGDSSTPKIKNAATDSDVTGGVKSSKPKGPKDSLIRRLSKRPDKSPARSETATTMGAENEASTSAASLPAEVSGGSKPASAAKQPSLLTASNTPSQLSLSQGSTSSPAEKEPGGMAVIFKPREPILVSNGDVNISLERRNRAPASMGLTMVTAVAHVWFNVFFEGNGPEQDGKSDDSGVFEIEWDKMDGIKGSSRKGVRGLDRIAVVWRCVDGEDDAAEKPQSKGVEIVEPAVGEEVPQMPAADWKGHNREDPSASKHLGLRAADPDSENVSKASSIKSAAMGGEDKDDKEDSDLFSGVKASGPAGEDLDNDKVVAADDAAKTEAKKNDITGRKPDQAKPDDGLADATAQKGFIVD
ncbi:uncharacterized protein PgNI_03569 [Pyricularia grisea]|uniref:phosphatidylinositol-3,4,5-trisphosphate 3-phosphatase n=1 Tax=Pyricularia grisea TaxID=148305 RepID=A0A6P8BF87_PYRGI|nr:uncharacterized protein PgNI_03569 [Pyricularia grisea]TLD14384.1 hypothetical protein PgNI_03569 [Pyricularia grisea]